jgi:DNA-binding CsgD family transcriptional regulator
MELSSPIVFAGYYLLVVLGIGVFALVNGRRSESGTSRQLWRLIALLMGTALAASVLTIAAASRNKGWEAWWIAQAALVLALGTLVMSVLVEAQRLARRLSDLESLVAEALHRVDAVDLDSLDLTARESEILEVIGSSNSIDDRTLSEVLRISSHTVHSHITNILRKARLRDRRDLQTLAYALRAHRDARSRTGK